jgi:hypothetical protein
LSRNRIDAGAVVTAARSTIWSVIGQLVHSFSTSPQTSMILPGSFSTGMAAAGLACRICLEK